MNKCIKIKGLLPALVETKEQLEMAELARKSFVSVDPNICFKVQEDNKRYKARVAGVWNAFLDEWRGKEYDYLLIGCDDGQFDINCVDFMVKYSIETDTPIVSAKCIRDLEEFKKGFGQREYTTMNTVTEKKDPAIFLMKKGVIETVGRMDETFPMEFVERDWLYRCKLAGFEWGQPDVVLMYHPPYAGTNGNAPQQLQRALMKYILKWGGDADQEKFIFPYNNLALDYTYAK